MITVDAESAVIALLKLDAGVTSVFYGTLTGNASTQGYRIWPDKLDQGCLLPAAVIFEVDGMPRMNTDGPGLETCRIQIDVYAATRNAAWSALAAIDLCLCPRQLEAGGLRRHVQLSTGTVLIQGIVPDVRRSFWEHETKHYRRGRDYFVTASAA